MMLSIWSVLTIFVVAPLALAGLVTTIVLLTTSRSRPWAEGDQAVSGDEAEPESDAEDEAGEPPSDENDADSVSD